MCFLVICGVMALACLFSSKILGYTWKLGMLMVICITCEPFSIYKGLFLFFLTLSQECVGKL
jgi:hypothetical protein